MQELWRGLNSPRGATSTSVASSLIMGQGATQILLLLSVSLTALVQTQRVAPASLALPLSLRILASEPWRVLTAFLYSEGFTFSYVIRLHAIACVSRALEHACTAMAPPKASPSRASPMRPLAGSALYVVCLLIGFLLLCGAAALNPAELVAPFLFGSLVLFLCRVSNQLPQQMRLAVCGVGVPDAPWFAYAVLIGSSAYYGAEASRHLVGAIGGDWFDDYIAEQLRGIDSTLSHGGCVHHEVVCNLLRHHGVVLIPRMRPHKVAEVPVRHFAL